MQIQPRFVLPTRMPTLLSSVAPDRSVHGHEVSAATAGVSAAQAESTVAATPAPRTTTPVWKAAFGASLVAVLARLLLKKRPAPGHEVSATQAGAPTDAFKSSWLGDRLHERRNEWFISQYKNDFNPNEDVAKNANCGPACVTMIAKGFGKLNVSAGQADAAIEETRRRMGESLDEKEWTSGDGLVKAAKSYGMSAYNTVCKTLGDFKAELAKGRMLVANVIPKYLDEANTGGHFTVVTAIKDGKVYLNDPISSKGPVAVSEQDFMRAVKLQKTYAVTSIGA